MKVRGLFEVERPAVGIDNFSPRRRGPSFEGGPRNSLTQKRPGSYQVPNSFPKFQVTACKAVRPRPACLEPDNSLPNY